MARPLLPLLALPLAWLLPNHYPPWLSAWQEGTALAALLVAAAFTGGKARVDWPWLALAAAASASVVTQWLTGKILFGGDALMVLLYGGSFVLALAVGHSLMSEDSGAAGNAALETFAGATVAAAILSVGLALVQWTGAVSLGLLGTDMPPGARPFANVSQPNHLCSLLFLGLCSAMLLKESRRIGGVTFGLVASFMLLGMVLSGSRTGWLQIGSLVVVGVGLCRRAQATVRPAQLVALAATFAAATVVWPLVNDALLLSGGRGVMQQLDGGTRAPLWLSLVDALLREPLWGYGWQQVTLAQQAAALDHAPIQRHFEHSHNLVLDLLLWAGVPVGLAICSLAGWALWRLLRSMRDPRALWLMAGVWGLLVHAMLELPLEYAYFLLPVGLALGAVTALRPEPSGIAIPVWTRRAAGVAGLLLLLAVATEYLEAEQSHRLLRMESARIGASRIESTPPDLKLLTQLSAFQAFARTEARTGMAPEDLDRLRRAARRFNYPPSMLLHATAVGLNGHPEEARETLHRLCRIHPEPRCSEAKAAWTALQRAHPALLSIKPP